MQLSVKENVGILFFGLDETIDLKTTTTDLAELLLNDDDDL